ncbi:RHS repeat-associated core domain-containing protein [Kibdelosporangium aridum]|nr:RHS repeat-associated core domain-containing protein [Kibdelosporangium aridum]
MTVSIAATVAVALATPQVAIAENQPSVNLPETAALAANLAAVAPHNPADAPSEKNALKGTQQPRVINGGSGTYAATSLAPSAAWQVSGQTGEFSWSYGLPVTPVPGGVQPTLALSYSSSAVDGLTSTTNNQTSWIGDGWAMWPGFIERTYEGCQRDVDDTPDDNPLDQCWRSDNATVSINGSANALILDDGSKVWRTRNDDGSKVERFGTPHDRNEHWKITTTDGTQYFFGSRAESKSAWKVPVFGDDSGEPCHNPAGYASSWCDQHYRWNIDKVISRNGDMMVYNYETEANKYGRNKGTAVSDYTRSGYLTTVEYGLRADNADVKASGRMVFDTAERCIDGTDCNDVNNLPDVPSHLKCTDNVCKDNWGPSFFTTKRLAKVTTEMRKDGVFKPVDSWTLRHTYPEPGSGERPAMWLAGITHTGHTGPAGAESIPLPEVTFEGSPYPNRVYTPGDGHSKLIRYRMNAIYSEAGAVTGINYAEPECKAGETVPDKNNLHLNNLRCYPAKWAAPLSPERTDYFHKYVVSQVTELDRMGSTTAVVTSYQYPARGVAWHWDDSEFTPDKDRTYNDYRGYGTVTVLKGNGTDSARSKSVQTFYRGMNGNKWPGGTNPAVVKDSEGGEAADEDWLRGQIRESITYLGETDTVVSKTINEPYFRLTPTAKRGPFKAYLVRPGTARTYTPLASGGVHQTKVVNGYEPDDLTGVPSYVNDLGDVTTDADDKCTRTTYDRRPDKWLMVLPARAETVTVHCDVKDPAADKVISDVRTTFDATGNPSEVSFLADRRDGAPVFVSKARTPKYDIHGRALEVLDAENNKSTVQHTPETGGPVLQVTTTNPKGYTGTTTYDPLRGVETKVVDINKRVTESTYDALGRVTETWTPDRDRSRRQQGSAKYRYTISRDAPNAVETKKVGPRGNYITTTQIYDGLLRPRQTQTPTRDGRLLSDTRYDSHGRAYLTTSPFYNKAPVDMALWQATNLDGVPAHVVTKYDGAERPVEQIFMAPTEQWKTTTEYGGDRVTVTPPAGGTPTTTITNARGQVIQKLTHAPAGADATNYAYHPGGQLAEVTDPGANKWKFFVDLAGRQIRSEDPARGATTTEYNKLGQPVKVTDARGRTLTMGYDSLNRRTHVSSGDTKLAEWTYDTASNGIGMPATSTRYVNGHAYVTKVNSYDIGGRPSKSEVVIPAVEGKLAGNYVTSVQYGPDGTPINAGYPQIDTMPAETVTFSHDDLGRPTTTTSSLNGQTDYVSQSLYTVYGELERLQYGTTPNRAWLSYYFDEKTRRFTRSIVDTETSKPMQTDVNYTYDPAGNVLSVVDKPIGQKVDTQCFRYDHLRRLTEAWTPDTGCAEPVLGTTGPAPYWQSFQYDKIGNRLSDTLRASGMEATSTYAYTGQSPRLESASLGRLGFAAQAASYEYDLAGNTTKRNGQELAWDDEGLLAKVTDTGGDTSFVYSADGTRLIRHDPAGSTLYLGSQEVRAEKSGALTVTRFYSHGDGRQIAVRTGGKLTFVAPDHQGTNEVAIDLASLKVDRRRQLPFGGSRGQQPLFPGEKGFVGGTVDSSIGLTTMGPRQYDSQTGRFLSVDPIMDPEDSQQMHGYTYSNNSPITFSDPSGTWLVGGEDPYTGNQYGVRNNSDGSQTWIGTPPATSGSNGRGVNSRINPNGGGYINGIRIYADDTRDFTKLLAIVHDENLGKHKTGYSIHGTQASRYDTAWMILNACGRLKDTSAACSKDFVADIEHIKFSSPDFPSGHGRSGGTRSAAKAAAKEAKKLAKKASEGCSFTAETVVVMGDGTRKPISEVKPGDQVLASNPETGEKGARTVTAVKVHDDTVQDLELVDGSRVTTTFDHPIWNETDREWQWAQKLDRGDSLLGANGERVKVGGLVPVTSRWAPAYDLTVADLRSFYVVAGQQPLLVHNCPQRRLYRVGNDGADDSIQEPISPDQWILNGETLDEGDYFFVVMPDNEVRAFKYGDHGGGHSSLSERMDVVAAGEFEVNSRGVITEFSNFSGHYWPKATTEDVIVEAFSQHGFDLDNAKFKPWTPPKDR